MLKTSHFEFDARRALLMHRDIFPPLLVQATQRLRNQVTNGNVHEETPVLVTERDAATMVLLRRQLSYHHVAQGEVGGEPWMVSF